MKDTGNLMLALIALAMLLAVVFCGVYEQELIPNTGAPEIIEKTVTLEEAIGNLEKVEEFVEIIESKPDTYDVPLDEELQFFVIEKSKSYGIDPAIIFAMIERESNYKADAIGDNGKSFGYMQIQKRFHGERMDRLGVTDLLNPYENIKVGIDFFAELLVKYDGNVEMALTSYNCGATGAYRNFFQYGVYSSEYSKAVIESAESIKQANSDK